MAVINSELNTMLDLSRAMDPNGAITKVIELLSRPNTLLADAVAEEGNLPTGDRYVSRHGLPAIYWRRFNEGISPSKSQSSQIDETCGMLEGRSIVDYELAQVAGNPAAYRAREEMAFVQQFRNTLETSFFYESTKNTPERINGLTPRLDTVAAGTPGASQVIRFDPLAAGVDSTSVWLIKWGYDSTSLIYPKGTQQGLKNHDMGVQYVRDASGKEFRAYATDWIWKVGVRVKDYRSIVRISNIDATTLTADNTALINAMIDAYHAVWDLQGGKPIFYVNRRVASFLHKQALGATMNSTLSIQNIGGAPITTFLGIPVHVTDALLNVESPVATV